jgi:hypothetical protein
MNEFDQFMKHTLKTKHYIRYADDFVILHTDKKLLEGYRTSIENFLGEKLKLRMHPNKVFIKTYASGVDFLGFVHFPHHRTLRTTTKKRMFKKLAKNGYKNESLNSYMGMLRHGNTFEIQNQVARISGEEYNFSKGGPC